MGTNQLQAPIHFRRVRNVAKKNTAFVVSVCPSVRMKQLGSHSIDFHEI